MAKKRYEIIAKRWQDSAGNTYHSVVIYENGVIIAHEPYTYGYESQWEYTALKMLHKLGIATRYDVPWKWAAEYGREYVYRSVIDVKRKKDLDLEV